MLPALGCSIVWGPCFEGPAASCVSQDALPSPFPIRCLTQFCHIIITAPFLYCCPTFVLQARQKTAAAEMNWAARLLTATADPSP